MEEMETPTGQHRHTQTPLSLSFPLGGGVGPINTNRKKRPVMSLKINADFKAPHTRKRKTHHHHLVQPCDVCGDVGFPDKIVTCFLCQIAREHIYCTQVLLPRIPEIWICESCRPSMDSSNMVHDDAIRSVGASSSFKDSEKSVYLRKEIALGKDKVKFISSEEAIKLSSEKGSFFPGKQGSRSRKSTTMASLPKFSQKKVTTNRTASLNVLSNSPAHGRKCPSSITQHQMKDITAPVTHPNRRASKRRPADVTPLKRVEISNSRKEKAIKFALPRPNDIPPVTGPGRSNINAKSMVVHKSNLPNIYLSPEEYFPNFPTSEAAWCGSFKIAHSDFHCEFYDGFRAHFPSRVHHKALEASKQMPGVLLCKMLPSSVIRLEAFHDEYASIDDIGLYFFPGNFLRSEEQYERLLEIVDIEDLILRSELLGVELLIFSSKWLHVDFQGLPVQPFLWGVFRRVKRNLRPLSLAPCNDDSQAEAESSNVQTEVKQLFYKVKVEQLNASDVPPGFSKPAFGAPAARDVEGSIQVKSCQVTL